MQKGRILAIDYGNSTVGLAVSDPDRLMAFGRGSHKGLNEVDLLDKIKDLVVTDKITTVVLGLPLSADGSDTKQTLRIREFGSKLKDKISELPVEIKFLDESFSTFEANQILQKIGVKSADRKQTEDEMAAIVLVHRYIDYKP